MTKNDKQKPGYKHTALGWIPEEWEVKCFENVAEIDKVSLPSNTPANYQFRYISLSDVDSDFIKIEVTQQIFATAPSRARRIVKKGDVLMSTVRPNLQGFTIIKEEVKDLIASTGFAVISAQKCFNYYLYNFLFSSVIQKQFYQLLVGSNYPALNSSDIKKLMIPLPPILEQKAIAALFCLWDKAIEITKNLITEKELRKRAIMQKLLTGKKRLPGFNGEWKELRLGEIFNERNETGYNNLPLLSVGAAGIYLQSDSIKKDTSTEDKSKYKRILPGDIGYNTMRMWQGRSALSNIEGIVSPAYTIISAKNEHNSIYFSYLFKLPHIIYYFFSHSQGLVDDTLNCKYHEFATIKVIVPCLEEQRAITSILQKADEEISIQKQKLNALKMQKKGLMQVLLTGQKRITL